MLLSWTHYRTLLQVFDKKARDWYVKEAFSKLGVQEHYKEILIHNIIIDV